MVTKWQQMVKMAKSYVIERILCIAFIIRNTAGKLYFPLFAIHLGKQEGAIKNVTLFRIDSVICFELVSTNLGT